MAAGEMVCVIMAGGAGTRFWPASTSKHPKQFLRLTSERSLLQEAFDRARAMVGPERILVLTSADFFDLCAAQLPELPAEQIVAEPLRRDTSAAVALAVALCEHRYGDPVMAVLTADHHIEPTDAFVANLRSAAAGAEAHPALYTLGIPPTHPATGYGYLDVGEQVDEHAGQAHFALRRFVEKPDKKTAEGYLEAGNFLWNSGMFVWKTSTVAAEFERLLPAHLPGLREAVEGGPTPEGLRAAFEPLEKVSVDYGVMEKAREVRCLKATFSWSDVGGFPALEGHLPKDEHQNASRGQLRTLDAEGNLVFCEDEEERVALIGVRDLIVVRAGKSTLVVPKARAEEIKALVTSLPDEER